MIEWWNDLCGECQLFLLLSFFTAIFSPIVICKPEWLSKNTFLEIFIPHQIIPVLTIFLTVMFVAVVTIHGVLPKIMGKMSDDDQLIVGKIRDEISNGALFVFWAFFFCIVALIAKGVLGRRYIRFDATMIVVSLLILVCNGFIFHDIYSAAFIIAPLIPG